MTEFVYAGPKRYPHQTRGLKKLIATGGIGALLFDPGLGKTATSLDFCSILALKQPVIDGVQEARVLVICPLVAVDTWVRESAKWVSPQVNYWAEALGGSIRQRAEALASRGGNRMTKTKLMRTVNGVRMEAPPRSEHWQRSLDYSARSDVREVHASDGPDGLGTNKPRLIIEVLNFDTFSSRQSAGRGTMADVVLDGVKRYNPHLVIVDESHRIKGHSSNVSRLIDRVGQIVPKRIILTGTVMPAGPLDVFGQWRFLDPYAFGERQPDGSVKRATYDSFRRRFAVLGGWMGKEVVGYRNLDELQRIMAQRAVVARKEDELGMKPPKEIVIPVILSPAEKKAYADMKKQLASELSNGSLATAPNRLAQIMRLRQITAGHLPDDMGIVHELGDSKARTLASIAHDTLAGKKRIVVFSLFVHEFNMLMEKMKREGTIVLGISGDTPTEERIRIRQRFGSDEDSRMILVAQITTMSLSVNELVSAQDVLFGSLSQRRDDLIQGIDRLNRIGQKGEVTVWFAEAPGTIDTVIHQSHKDRTSIENAVLRHILDSDEEVQRVLQAARDAGAA